jgi:site-specific DNA-methyltransferase (adenine-specific)
MKDQVLQAFLHTRDGFSPDVVITDPAVNARFLAACRELGAEGTDRELNHCLYNLRKSHALEDYPTTRRARVRRQDEYSFAAEIAARYLERRYDTTVDRIICDPALAQEFDTLAAELAPGFAPFEYRFTALSLRKKRRLRPEIAPQLLPATRVESFPVDGLDLDVIPKSQGVYLFYYKGEGLLYLGEAMSLRDRVRQHLDHSDRKELARWLWEHGTDDLYVEIHILPDETTNAARKALELDLIRSRHPRFNILGTEIEE